MVVSAVTIWDSGRAREAGETVYLSETMCKRWA